jgi:hypothetical protein
MTDSYPVPAQAAIPGIEMKHKIRNERSLERIFPARAVLLDKFRSRLYLLRIGDRFYGVTTPAQHGEAIGLS